MGQALQPSYKSHDEVIVRPPHAATRLRDGWIDRLVGFGTHMTPVLIGKDLILEGSRLKIKDKQVLGRNDM